ncbi:MAG TPA: PilZ domain-containing protein [Polyangiaceae bacterium]|nr:PilZ domain-containing protein [Polyangiaceae bacterium]
MSDAVTLARSARESLARGLNALQGDPNVPRHLLDLAAPIAQAMGSLHQIERSGGAQIASSVQTALGQIQTALAQLQAHPPTHPAVASALETVAAALGTVHALARMEAQPPAASAKAAAPVKAAPAPPKATAPAVQASAPAYPPAAPVARASPPTGQAPALAFQATAVAPPAAPRPAPAAAPAPAAPATKADRAAPAPRAPQPAPQPAAQAAAQRAPAPNPSAPGVIDPSSITAELGAHSPSNFYKGLSGNDIIDHGGLFVSTYKLPKIGVQVRLRVALPGGYEFEANAIVRWRREPSDAGNDAPPGFGAQFTEITTEARQLVYRYVRNREPLFHDDL